MEYAYSGVPPAMSMHFFAVSALRKTDSVGFDIEREVLIMLFK
jgi:hypothetical protein